MSEDKDTLTSAFAKFDAVDEAAQQEAKQKAADTAADDAEEEARQSFIETAGADRFRA